MIKNDLLSHTATCPSCGATYKRWLALQTVCPNCYINAALMREGLAPNKTLPDHLARFLEREWARHHG